MAKRGTLLLSNVRLLLRSCNVRQLERCCQTKPKTPIATLHFWPAHELQLHRTFASSTNSDDTEETWRKKHDKHKDEPTNEFETGERATSRQERRAETKNDCDADDVSRECALHRKRAMILATRMLNFKKKQEEPKNLSGITKKFRENRQRIMHIKDRLAILSRKEKSLQKGNVEKTEKTKTTKEKTVKPMQLIKRPQKKSKPYFTWDIFSRKTIRRGQKKQKEQKKQAKENLLVIERLKKFKQSEKEK